jgi:hypothetical protein
LTPSRAPQARGRNRYKQVRLVALHTAELKTRKWVKYNNLENSANGAK